MRMTGKTLAEVFARPWCGGFAVEESNLRCGQRENQCPTCGKWVRTRERLRKDGTWAPLYYPRHRAAR